MVVGGCVAFQTRLDVTWAASMSMPDLTWFLWSTVSKS